MVELIERTGRIVVGGSVASLVAADSLASQGEQVRLLLPESGVGAGFTGRVLDGRVLDFGVRVLELDYEDVGPEPDLVDYHAGHAGHRPYIRMVDRWVRDLLGGRIVEVDRPLMFFDGRLVDDLYFTTDLSVLRNILDPAELAVIAAQTRGARDALGSDAGVLDASTSDQLATMTLDAASLSNHGGAFHQRFVQPIADKFAGTDGGRALATLRRRVWLPLFWPRTLHEACGEEPITFRAWRPLHTVSPCGVTGLVDALRARLVERGVSIETAGSLEALECTRDGYEQTRMHLSRIGWITADRPVVGVAPKEIFAAVGADYAPTSARSVLAWVEVADAEVLRCPSLVTVVDPTLPAVRISMGGRGKPGCHLFTVELRHDLPEAEIASAAVSSLRAIGLIRPQGDVDVITTAAGPGWTLPCAENEAVFQAARNTLDSCGLQAEIVGGATAFAADSLNEQIIQGLRAAKVTAQCHS